MNAIKYVVSSAINILFRVPFLILSGVCYGISYFFECLGDALKTVQLSIKPMTFLPYVNEWNKQLLEMKESERLRYLEKLKHNTSD